MEPTLAVIAAQPYALDLDEPPPVYPGEVAEWLTPQHGKDEDPDDQLDAVIWAALLHP
jgi:hypothetical protein